MTVCGKEWPGARTFMYIRKGLREDTDKKIDDYLFFNFRPRQISLMRHSVKKKNDLKSLAHLDGSDIRY